MKNATIAIVTANYRKEVTDSMEAACLKTLIARGVVEGNITHIQIPGSLEIPLIVKKLAQKKTYDAIITFGVVLKGDTYHFEQIANETVRACMDISLEYGIPVIYEILTVYTIQQAHDRALARGKEAAETALKMIDVLYEITN